MTKLTTWLRTNSQHYLLRDSQARIARKYGITPPDTSGPFFWTKVFVPIYRVLPWGFTSSVMAAMPGSHRKHWRKQAPPMGSAV
jgi:hypothetical protein